jgi:hypothetical protein
MRMAGCVGLALAAAVAVGCKKEAGPRPNHLIEEACRREPELSLDDFCEQSPAWEADCERFESYEQALAQVLADCADTAFPLAIGDCGLRVIERSLSSSGVLYYYDGDELVGIRTFTDRVYTCPEGSAREQSVTVQVGGRIDEECETCHLCGATVAEPEVCKGETAEPYVEQCRETFDFAPECEPCACEQCFPWTFTDNASINEIFQTCVADHCEVCIMPPDDDDAGMSEDASTPPSEDASTPPSEDASTEPPPDDDGGA